MQKRFVSIWFRHLLTDWQTRRQPELKTQPFVFAVKDHGRMIITATNALAEEHDIAPGNAVADAKAIVPDLISFDDIPGKTDKLLAALGEWCIRYSPFIAADAPDGLLMDASGCAHLWGGELEYVKEICGRLGAIGYDVRAAMADTPGAAWAMARYGQGSLIVPPGLQYEALLPLPPSGLRLEQATLQKLVKLGLYQIKSFINMPRSVLRRRFGYELIDRLAQALGNEEETILPMHPVMPYVERLPCPEPIRTATGIEIAIKRLLDALCERLRTEGNGLRTAILKSYRIDGKLLQTSVATNRATHHVDHIYKLFELKIATIEPALGIELFVLDAPKVEEVVTEQETLWTSEACGLEDIELAELLDRIAGKLGWGGIRRYLPQEHYWPERAIKQAVSIAEALQTEWRVNKPRPVELLPEPEPIQVSSVLPDYPPMLFIHKGELHKIARADGPERIEREWWLDAGEHRDYYVVEDAHGQRFWLFRSGHYQGTQTMQWFLHGYFA